MSTLSPPHTLSLPRCLILPHGSGWGVFLDGSMRFTLSQETPFSTLRLLCEAFQSSPRPKEELCTGQDFSAALRACKAGAKIGRRGWNGKGMHVRIERIDSVAFLALQVRAGGPLVPWTISQTDALAEDWHVVD